MGKSQRRYHQNPKKSIQKSIKKSDASWDRFLKGFWWILGGEMEPSWDQNPIKIDVMNLYSDNTINEI